MTEKQTEFTPNYLSVPGETLASLLRERGLSLAELVAKAELPSATVKGILRGKLVIDVAIASALEKALGVPARLWLRRQALYEQHRSRLESQHAELAHVAAG